MPSYALKRKIYKYYKDMVVTKYWKEVTTETEGTVLAYACYYLSDGSMMGTSCLYAKTPLGSDSTPYASKKNGYFQPASGVDDITAETYLNATFASITEDQAVLKGQQGSSTLPRKFDYDLYTTGTITTTTTVEGTPNDYTYTTTETVTTEVTANDDYDRAELVGINVYFPMRRQQDVNGVTQFASYSFNRK